MNILKLFFQVLLILISSYIYSQNVDHSTYNDSLEFAKPDLKYREDQIYFGVTNSIVQEKPKNYNSRSISIGLNIGILRDFPINTDRTISVAPGIGYSYLNLKNNLGIQEDNGSIRYLISNDFSKNSQSFRSIEFPLEFRWRNSTSSSYKFWRIHLGLSLKYLFYYNHRTTLYGTSYSNKVKSDVNIWNYGLYLSSGYNTWNLYVYYGLKPIYKQNILGDKNLRNFNIGLIFYIL